jgi:hypothetical protein
MPEADKFLELKRYKAKLVQLHATRREKTVLDTSDHDRMDEEEPSLFHLIKTLQRRNMRAIQRIHDSNRNTAIGPQYVANIFLNHLRKKFGPLNMDRESLPTRQAHIQPLYPASAESLERPKTAEEVIAANRSSAKHKSLGIDGICHEMYSANWETVNLDLLELLNHMFMSNNITPDRSTEFSYAFRRRTETAPPIVTAQYRF